MEQSPPGSAPTGFPCCVQSEHEDSHFLVAKYLACILHERGLARESRVEVVQQKEYRVLSRDSSPCREEKRVSFQCAVSLT